MAGAIVDSLMRAASRNPRLRRVVPEWSSEHEELHIRARTVVQALRPGVWDAVRRASATASERRDEGSARSAEQAVASLSAQLSTRHAESRAVRDAVAQLRNRMRTAMRG